jgi:hypothetical protein
VRRHHSKKAETLHFQSAAHPSKDLIHPKINKSI